MRIAHQFRSTLTFVPEPYKMESQKFKKTYHRKNPDSGLLEFMGYGGDSGTMNKNYFVTVTRKDSVFGMEVLRLKSVCWMNPCSTVENIPASWAKIDVAIYHAYLSGCNLSGADFNILVAT